HARAFDGAELRCRGQFLQGRARETPRLVGRGVGRGAVAADGDQCDRFEVLGARYVDFVRRGETREGAGSTLRLGAGLVRIELVQEQGHRFDQVRLGGQGRVTLRGFELGDRTVDAGQARFAETVGTQIERVA